MRIMKPADCINCGSEKERHSGRDRNGYCFDGSTGEDATTYERAGIWRTARGYWRQLVYRFRPPFHDIASGFD